MKGRPKYKSEPRNNYGAVDYYEGNHCISNTMAGIQPQYLADTIESKLNEAVEKGFNWSAKKIERCIDSGDTELEVLRCIQTEIDSL